MIKFSLVPWQVWAIAGLLVALLGLLGWAYFEGRSDAEKRALERAQETSRAIDGVDTGDDPLGSLCRSLGRLGGPLCRDEEKPDSPRGGADHPADR